MTTQNLPTDDLKKYGIFNSDNTFTKKLSEEDIQKFLSGDIIIADNDKHRVTFQLKEQNSKLKVNVFERDKSISELLINSKNEIQYSDTISKYNINEENTAAQLSWTKSAFIFDKINQNIVEYDMIKHAPIVTQIIAERNKAEEINVYKTELEKLQSFLQDKIDKYPEIAKEITDNLNIVSKELNNVNSISPDEKQLEKGKETEIHLDVNDKDLYEDANRMREENEEIEENESQERPRGFRR